MGETIWSCARMGLWCNGGCTRLTRPTVCLSTGCGRGTLQPVSRPLMEQGIYTQCSRAFFLCQRRKWLAMGFVWRLVAGTRARFTALCYRPTNTPAPQPVQPTRAPPPPFPPNAPIRGYQYTLNYIPKKPPWLLSPTKKGNKDPRLRLPPSSPRQGRG